MKVEYRCTECGTAQPLDFVSDTERPPERIEGICGLRWDGCGELREMEMVAGSE